MISDKMYRERRTNISYSLSNLWLVVFVSLSLCTEAMPVQADKWVQAGAAVSCIVDADCTDDNVCTTDRCVDELCANDDIPGCVPCEPLFICPPIEIVFIMDTSGSMVDEAAALCNSIDQMVADLSADGTEVISHILGITETGGSAFPCVNDHVVAMMGSDVPGLNTTCAFPDNTSSYESWGPATSITALHFPWTAGAIRIIAPISDEGPCNGSRPDGCNDPGDDRDSIDNAILSAANSLVTISPITGTGAIECVLNLAELIASQTGGITRTTANAQTDIPESIRQIVMAQCLLDDACDDNNACSDNDTCTNGICVGVPNFDDTIFCCDPLDRTLNWLSDNDGCTDDVCDEFTGQISHPPSAEGTNCDDGNLCTDQDVCTQEICKGQNNFDDTQFCCKASNRTLTPLSDEDACTDDLCDSETGTVSHVLSPTGTSCDDDELCTINDTCDELGVCQGIHVNTLSCSTENDCPSGVCNFEINQCVCGEHSPELRLIAQPFENEETCYPVGHLLNVKVELGFSTSRIAGGTFIIDYDPEVLRFINIATGNNIDPDSPFKLEIIQIVDESFGQIIYSVGIQIGSSGTTGPVTMAGIQFETLKRCATTTLCFTNQGVFKTVLSDDQGVSVPFIPVCSAVIQTLSDEPVLLCPQSVETNADAGTIGAIMTWDPVTTSSSCGQDLVPVCTATHSEGYDINALIETGGEFLSGVAEFSCSLTDECGQFDTCEWSVTVHPVNTVEVDLELSPIISDFHQPLIRCIEFHFIDNCFHTPVIIEKEIDFGLLFNFTGSANNVRFEVPAGVYQCMTAGDPKHTVRSGSNVEIVNGIYKARFRGDPLLGGNWLLNGNLDGNDIIDIVDFGILLDQSGVNIDPDTPCGLEDIHADLNGDGIVDDLDQAMIFANFLATDQQTCCSEGGDGTTTSAPRTEISFYELERMGLYGLEKYDTNGDGMLSLDDMNRRTTTQKRFRKRSKNSRIMLRQIDNALRRRPTKRD